MTSISQAHRARGLEPPTTDRAVREVWRGIRRAFGTASNGRSPLLTDDVRAMVGHFGDRPIDIRDRALVLLTYSSALRRSELVALDVDDVTETTT